jgi:hypothetical protein
MSIDQKLDPFKKRVTLLQAELIAPKNQYNSFAKFHYRSQEDILTAVKKLLPKYELLLTISDDVEMIGDRWYIKSTCRLEDCHSDEYIENTAYAREPQTKKGMDESQISGMASSYCRKYCLNGLLCIDDSKDADTQDNRESQKKPKSDSEAMVAIYNKLPQPVKDLMPMDLKNVNDLEKLETLTQSAGSNKDQWASEMPSKTRETLHKAGITSWIPAGIIYIANGHSWDGVDSLVGAKQ